MVIFSWIEKPTEENKSNDSCYGTVINMLSTNNCLTWFDMVMSFQTNIKEINHPSMQNDENNFPVYKTQIKISELEIYLEIHQYEHTLSERLLTSLIVVCITQYVFKACH